MPSEGFDVIIIGGGTAGLVLATRLSEDPNVRVAVIEAGGDRMSDLQVLTPGMFPISSNTPTVDWVFKTVPQTKLGDKEITFPQGRALGGSSAINSHLFNPTSKANVDAWVKLGNQTWDFTEFEKAEQRSYTFHKPSAAPEGSGPIQLTVQTSEVAATWAKTWTEGLQTLGFPQCDPFDSQVCGSIINPEAVDPEKRQRSCSANAYLGLAKGRTNLTVLAESTVTKILLDNSDPDSALVMATGVQILTKDGETKTIDARREVILAAGAINSPRILELSGIGSAELLHRLNIEVMVQNQYVGENLQSHVYTGLNFEVRDGVATWDDLARGLPEAVAAAEEAYSKGTWPYCGSGVVASAQLPFPGNETEEGQKELEQLIQDASAQAKASRPALATPAFLAAHESFVRSVLASPQEASANYDIAPMYVPFFTADASFRPPGNRISVIVTLSHPLSRGSVHVTSASPERAAGSGDVAVDPRYLSHPLDLEILARHVQYAEHEVARAEPLARRLKPYRERFTGLKDAREYVRRTAKGAHHYTGTCAMMPRYMGGVVDENLVVHGCKNLRVCDASIIPIEPRANTQAVVYGVAEMGAKLIKESMYKVVEAEV